MIGRSFAASWMSLIGNFAGTAAGTPRARRPRPLVQDQRPCSDIAVEVPVAHGHEPQIPDRHRAARRPVAADQVSRSSRPITYAAAEPGGPGSSCSHRGLVRGSATGDGEGSQGWGWRARRRSRRDRSAAAESSGRQQDERDRDPSGRACAPILPSAPTEWWNGMHGEGSRYGQATTRIVIEHVSPVVDGGLFPAKTSVGDVVPIEADVFTDGHVRPSARAWIRHETEDPRDVPMVPLGNDRGARRVPIGEPGAYPLPRRGWIDRWATWRADLVKRCRRGPGRGGGAPRRVGLLGGAAPRRQRSCRGRRRRRSTGSSGRCRAGFGHPTGTLVTRPCSRRGRPRSANG